MVIFHHRSSVSASGENRARARGTAAGRGDGGRSSEAAAGRRGNQAADPAGSRFGGRGVGSAPSRYPGRKRRETAAGRGDGGQRTNTSNWHVAGPPTRLESGSSTAPRRNARGTVLAVVLLLGVLAGASADTAVSARLTLQNVLTWDSRAADAPLGVVPGGTAELIVASRGNSQVRGELRLSSSIASVPDIVLSRAWLKFRFADAGLVVTLGKARLGWGEGLVFNAGDLVHGSTDTAVNLSAEEPRGNAAWLSALTLTTGQFSFVEFVFRPGEIALNPNNPLDPPILPTAEDLAAGLRARFPIGPVNVETAYLWGDDAHRVVASLQFALGLNWFVSGRLDVPADWDLEVDSLGPKFSGGVYDIFPLGGDTKLSVRLETLWLPATDQWLYLYPDLSLSWDQVHNLGLRALATVIDPSASWNIAYAWSGLQGISLTAGLSGSAGSDNSLFGWGSADARPDLALNFGARFVY